MIIIKAGTYTENVNITKGDITISSESGNPDDTTIKSKSSRGNVLSLQSVSNVKISGIKAIGASGDSYSGINLYKCSKCLIENNKLTNNGRGIYLVNSRECTISKNTVMDNGVFGIYLASSGSNSISENTVYNNNRGIYLGSSDYNRIIGNDVTYNENLGFYECSLCDYNKVYNNYFNNTNVTVKKGSGNSYNTTKTPGTNIIGGPYIGGNYWGKPDGTGFSDTAVDKDGDGIADSAYRLPGDSTYLDYLPLTHASNSPEPVIPVAEFSSNVISGNAPLDVSFTDISTGNPAAWYWDFGDGTNSADKNPVHTYSTVGTYTVTLTVTNSNGTTSKSGTITVLENTETVFPVADFGTNATQGSAPLAVQFTDLSQNAVSWSWDFDNNGQPDSTVQNPGYVYENPGDYTVNLTVSNANGTASKTTTISVMKSDGLPVADFSTSVTGGYAPLSVTFTDLSQDEISRSWDVNGDGIEDSNESSFVYEYPSAGTYTAKLTAINANGTDEKTAMITVNEEDNGGSSHSSGGSSGGVGGGSPEPAKNVEVKELAQVFITNGKAVKFDFTKNATCVVYVGFDAIKNVGKTTTIVEELKNKSELVSEPPEGEVYRHFNVWVGNSGFATSKNIEKPTICFKVEKSWLQNKSVDQDSITLNRYEDEDNHDGKDGTWTRLTANLTGEDDKFLYFTSEVPGFSFFTITGDPQAPSVKNITSLEPEQKVRSINGEDMEIKGPEAGQNSGQEKNTSVPGFEIGCGIACILAVSLYKRKSKN